MLIQTTTNIPSDALLFRNVSGQNVWVFGKDIERELHDAIINMEELQSGKVYKSDTIDTATAYIQSASSLMYALYNRQCLSAPRIATKPRSWHKVKMVAEAHQFALQHAYRRLTGKSHAQCR